MTIDRFLSIHFAVKCFKGGGTRPKMRIRVCVFLLYIFTAILFVPSAWQRTLVPFLEHTGRPPYRNRTFWRIGRNFRLHNSWLFSKYVFFREGISRILPIFVLVILNLFIIVKLRAISTRNNTRRAAPTEAARERDAERTKVSWLLVITSAIFVACTLPASALSFFFHHVGNDSVGMQVFRAIANCVQVSHYLHYFYLYALCSSEYRHALRVVFHGACPKGDKARAEAYAAANGVNHRRSTQHTPLPTTTETHTGRSRLSHTILGQIRQFGFYRYNRKMKSLTPPSGADRSPEGGGGAATPTANGAAAAFGVHLTPNASGKGSSTVATSEAKTLLYNNCNSHYDNVEAEEDYGGEDEATRQLCASK